MMNNNAPSVSEESVHSSCLSSIASVSNAGHRREQPQLFVIEDSAQDTIEVVEGTQPPQSIYVLGQLKNQNVIVLIDSGATRNIIDQAVVAKLGLPVTQCNKLQFMVGNRDMIECAAQCRALTILIQGHFVTADYYVVPASACQLILGVEWLETLGPIETDYKQLTMTFKVEGVPCTFKGLRQGSVATLTNKDFSGLQDSTKWKSPTNSIQWQDQAYNQLQLAKEKYKEDFNRAYQTAQKLRLQPCSTQERATREKGIDSFKRIMAFLSMSRSHLANFSKQDFCHKFSMIVGYLNRLRHPHASATGGSQPSQTRQQLNTTTHPQVGGDNIHTSMQDSRSRHVSGHQSQHQNVAPSYFEARQTKIPKDCLTGIGATQPSYHNAFQKSQTSAPLCTENKSHLANVGILPNFNAQSNFQREDVRPMPSLSGMDPLQKNSSTHMQVNSYPRKIEGASNSTMTPLPSNTNAIPSHFIRRPENHQTMQPQKVMPHQLRRVTHDTQLTQAEKLHGTKEEGNLRNRQLNPPIGQNRQSSFSNQGILPDVSHDSHRMQAEKLHGTKVEGNTRNQQRSQPVVQNRRISSIQGISPNVSHDNQQMQAGKLCGRKAEGNTKNHQVNNPILKKWQSSSSSQVVLPNVSQHCTSSAEALRNSPQSINLGHPLSNGASKLSEAAASVATTPALPSSTSTSVTSQSHVASIAPETPCARLTNTDDARNASHESDDLHGPGVPQPASIPDDIRATKKQKIEFAEFVFQEVEVINRRLIETVVQVIHRTTDFTHGAEGIILQFTFTAVGPNLHPSLALPDLVLQVVVQSDYPNLSPVILDRNPQPWSGNAHAKALWDETLQKFDRAIRTFPQPISIGQMVKAWDRSAHDTCREYAESLGGGSFSSRYGTWEKYIAT